MQNVKKLVLSVDKKIYFFLVLLRSNKNLFERSRKNRINCVQKKILDFATIEFTERRFYTVRGGYWVRRVKQLSRVPLFLGAPSFLGALLFENTAYSFILLIFFLKITMKLLRKVGKSQNEFI